MSIELNIREVQERIAGACERSSRLPGEVTLVAVTKTVDVAVIRSAFGCGIKDFGENRVQEAEEKIGRLSALGSGVTWHLIGHLQSNKAKTAAELFDIIHSVDSLRLAGILNRQTERVLPVLLEVNVSAEATKSGLAVDEVTEVIEKIRQLPNLEVKGLMTIAPLVADPEEVRPVFSKLRELRNSLGLEHLSMGMTDDFEVAIEEGATIVRVGRAIFGERRS